MRKVVLLIAICLILVLAACGRGRQDTDENGDYPNGLAEDMADGGVPQDVQSIRTLTILATYCDYLKL